MIKTARGFEGICASVLTKLSGWAPSSSRPVYS